MASSMADGPSHGTLNVAWKFLEEAWPTAINARCTLGRCRTALRPLSEIDRAAAALTLARDLADEDVEVYRRINCEGLALTREALARKHAGQHTC